VSPTVAIPTGPAPKRRSPARTLIIVLCIIVAVLVLAVLGVVAYANLRPVGAPDYRKASSDLTSLTEALEPMMVRQGQMMDLSVTPSQEQIDKVVAAQHEQLTAFTTAVTDYGSTRALRDPDLKALYDTLTNDTTTSLTPMVTDFVDHYGAVLTMVQACTAYDQAWPTIPEKGTNQAWFDSRITSCEKAVETAGASTTFAPLVKVRADHIAAARAAYKAYGEADAKGDEKARLAAQSAISKAQLGIGTRMGQATTAVAEANDKVFAAITADITALGTYCDGKS